MLSFQVHLKPGLPVSEQIIFAVKKAIVSGQIKPGDKFPSVRQISQDLKINPNTSHKVVASLVNAGLIQVIPGVGSVVLTLPQSSARERVELLEEDLEKVVVEAKKLGLDLEEVSGNLTRHWNRLNAKRGGKNERN